MNPLCPRERDILSLTPLWIKIRKGAKLFFFYFV